jgi:hypothetical protein
MAFRTIGFFPGCPDINRMLKFKIVSDVGIFHHSLFSLADNIMTEVAVT